MFLLAPIVSVFDEDTGAVSETEMSGKTVKH